ncbi:hypothetical protein PF007_g3036 [Phytophthora fragariae]|uniref:Uncharacterized protein n=1 Tax=Phytophthora fragariae TaxID=53985 RepID=A0A6A3UP13_9STRA|nr:hypothetical protein PF003_g23901 [Phytophthora fragariae]KAE8947066.1 hypothetical protein PF009_g3333 [Phytophthora fragariae]KAE9134214.1 hypothetical protein PF007_g3036 [Phytophthora fragariae]KAE9153365.1 hypothetical protein PF006_g2497 [Phytophthora fragariae]KAE9303838.1 hypothetical protein PF001_g13363 [Phytophthora fragariae]
MSSLLRYSIKAVAVTLARLLSSSSAWALDATSTMPNATLAFPTSVQACHVDFPRSYSTLFGEIAITRRGIQHYTGNLGS